MSNQDFDTDDILAGVRERISNSFVAEGQRLIHAAAQVSLQPYRDRIRRQLASHGTDVALNDRDRLGDGDQSKIELDHRGKQVYRDLFATGGDLAAMPDDIANTGVFTPFVLCCLFQLQPISNIKLVLDAANEPGKAPIVLLNLLENRETSMRLSPLLCLVAIGKNIPGKPGVSEAQFRRGELQICKLLLQYGARPDARDVCGKTAAHYGAGVMATPTTLDMVRMIDEAAESCYLFNQEVELFDLKKESLNSSKGICRGYDCDTGRRLVYLEGKTEPIAVKPENLRLWGEAAPRPKLKLVDLQDRLGGTPMLEVFMSNRKDVAEFLLEEMDASIDIADWDGYSPKSMASKPGAQFGSAVAPVVMKHAMKQEQHRKKNAEKIQKCSKCGSGPKGGAPLSVCSRCKTTAYCSRECQVAHWKTHKNECKERAAELEESITLEKPQDNGMFTSTISFGTGRASSGSYRKPSKVAAGETFFVKVQGNTEFMPLLIYDQTRECEFSYAKGQRGFDKMLAAVKADPAAGGRKTYMKACFDADGNCKVFPKQTDTKTW